MAEVTAYYQQLEDGEFAQIDVGSYAKEFLPLAIPNHEVSRFTHALALGCGHGGELIALRLFLGDHVQITGVDNNPELDLPEDKEELEQNLTVARAEFIFENMTQVQQIVERTGTPDLILIRHPGRMATEEGFQQVVARMSPWVQYAAENHTTLLLSFFDWYKEERDRIVNELITLHISQDHIQIIDKDEQHRMGYYSVGQSRSIFPDVYGIRIF